MVFIMSNIFYSVKKRDAKSNNNSIRKSGQVPGIIYGEFLEKSIPITMKAPELNKMLRSNNSGSIIKIRFRWRKTKLCCNRYSKRSFK